MLQLFFLLNLLFYHPLENGPFSKIEFLDQRIIIFENNIFKSPIDGIVDEILKNDNKFTIKISNESVELIFVGLDKILRNIGEELKVGDDLGFDYTVTDYTKLIFIQYNNIKLFPQFNNNKLTFITETQSNRIYSMCSGNLGNQAYDDYRGNYIEIINEDEYFPNIQYWHLSLMFRMENIINKGQLIGLSGNTGFSYSPRLTVYFINNFLDYKAIYIKSKLDS